MSATIDVRAGAIYLPAAVAATYFANVASVIVLIRDGTLQILPVRHAQAGGCLLKIRNAAGDRVASAPDVFQAHGLGDWRASGVAARWSSDQGALIASL